MPSSARAELGRACLMGANSVIGPGAVLGDEVRVGANAGLSHCLIGSRVCIYPGVRIGQDGFGFALIQRAISRCRNSGASSSATMLRSAQTRRSTAGLDPTL